MVEYGIFYMIAIFGEKFQSSFSLPPKKITGELVPGQFYFTDLKIVGRNSFGINFVFLLFFVFF